MDAHSEQTDVQMLFERWQAGDEHAREEFFKACLPAWHTSARIMLTDKGVRARPSDLVQQVVEDLLVWNQKNSFRDAKHVKRTFKLILKHRVFDLQRLVAKQQELPFTAVKPAKARGGSSLPEWDPSDHRHDPTRKSVADHLQEAISKLPAKEREVLEPYYFDGLTECEVADRVGRSERWVRELLIRAATFLKDQLGPDYRHPPWNALSKDSGFVEFLGEGSFGEVWKIRSPQYGDRALKDLWQKRKSAGGHGGSIVEGLRHPNIVQVFRALGNDEKAIDVVEMELVERTLADVLNVEGKIELPILLRYMWDAACGIDTLTKLAIIHRDIKPDNLGLVDGRVKVLDFGFATEIVSWLPRKDPQQIMKRIWLEELEKGNIDELPRHCFDKTTGGMTELYAPPEFFQNEIAKTSDQFSLGVTFVELRTGRLRFKGKKGLRKLSLTDLPPRERDVVAHCLDADPTQRWPDCCTFVRELTALYKNQLPADLLDLTASEPEPAEDRRGAGGAIIKYDSDDPSYLHVSSWFGVYPE